MNIKRLFDILFVGNRFLKKGSYTLPPAWFSMDSRRKFKPIQSSRLASYSKQIYIHTNIQTCLYVWAKSFISMWFRSHETFRNSCFTMFFEITILVGVDKYPCEVARIAEDPVLPTQIGIYLSKNSPFTHLFQ